MILHKMELSQMSHHMYCSLSAENFLPANELQQTMMKLCETGNKVSIANCVHIKQM
jgi:hypothetical protein